MPSLPPFETRSAASPFGDLQAAMTYRLKRWGVRTGLWGLGLFALSLWVPGLKFLFVLWVIFAVAAGAFILFGMRFLQRLKSGGGVAFTTFGGSPPGAAPDYAPPRPGTVSRDGSGEEIIEVEAEVLPPSSDSAGAGRR